MVKLLLDNGADVNQADKNGRTPLDKARSEKIKKILREAEKKVKAGGAAGQVVSP